MFGIDPQFLIQALGFAFIVAGVAARTGTWKNWYWRSRGAVYGYIPLGFLFLLYSFNAQAEERLGAYYVVYQGIGVLLLVLGVWWSLRPPAFVKPRWVRWIEEYPLKVRKAMQRAVENGDDWESHMTSREAVDAWVKTLRSKKRKSKSKTK